MSASIDASSFATAEALAEHLDWSRFAVWEARSLKGFPERKCATDGDIADQAEMVRVWAEKTPHPEHACASCREPFTVAQWVLRGVEPLCSDEELGDICRKCCNEC